MEKGTTAALVVDCILPRGDERKRERKRKEGREREESKAKRSATHPAAGGLFLFQFHLHLFLHIKNLDFWLAFSFLSLAPSPCGVVILGPSREDLHSEFKLIHDTVEHSGGVVECGVRSHREDRSTTAGPLSFIVKKVPCI